MMVVTILQWNARSLFKKLQDYEKYLSDLAFLPDVICIQETHVHSEIDISLSDSHVEISGIKTSTVSIFNIYNPPSNNFTIVTFDFLSGLKNVVLCRDFNSHHGMCGSQLRNSNGRNLMGLVEKHDYVILKIVIPSHLLSCLLESVGSDISFKFVGFALFQYGYQRFPRQ